MKWIAVCMIYFICLGSMACSSRATSKAPLNAAWENLTTPWSCQTETVKEAINMKYAGTKYDIVGGIMPKYVKGEDENHLRLEKLDGTIIDMTVPRHKQSEFQELERWPINQGNQKGEDYLKLLEWREM